MNAQISWNLPKLTIGQVTEGIFASGKISRADQESLRLAMLSGKAPSTEEIRQIKQVFERLQMGLLKVVD